MKKRETLVLLIIHACESFTASAFLGFASRFSCITAIIIRAGVELKNPRQIQSDLDFTLPTLGLIKCVTQSDAVGENVLYSVQFNSIYSMRIKLQCVCGIRSAGDNLSEKPAYETQQKTL